MRDVRGLVRGVLALAAGAGAIASGLSLVTGRVGPVSGFLLMALGIAAAYALPRGGRVAATLFAIWGGIGIVTLGRELVADEPELTDRLRYAAVCSIVFAASAAFALWACSPEQKNED